MENRIPVLSALIALAVLCECSNPEFPRDNPLDPINPHFVPPAVTSMSIDENQIFAKRDIDITWQGNENTKTYRYALDDTVTNWSEWSPVTSASYKNRDEGTHTFFVEPRTEAGTIGSALFRTFSIELEFPVVESVSIPDGAVFTTRNVDVSWTGNTNALKFQYTFDGKLYDWTESKTASFTGLDDTLHTFTVIPRFDSLLIGSPVTRTFTVRTDPAKVDSVSIADGDTVRTRDFIITWKGNHTAVEYKYKFDGIESEFSPDTKLSCTYLEEGRHTFVITPRNDKKKVGETKTLTFTVDAVPGPGVSLSPKEIVGISPVHIKLEEVSGLMSAHIELVCTDNCGVFREFTKKTGGMSGSQMIVYTAGENTGRLVLDIAFVGLITGVSDRLDIGSVIVKPSADGMVAVDGLTSKFRDINNRDVPLRGFDAVKAAPKQYTLSGQVTGASGVTVALSGDRSETKTVASDGGSWSFTVLEGGNYTVTPSKTGYEFEPPSQSFTNVTGNNTKDFTASETLLDIVMKQIPGGTFQMGDVEGSGDSDERPVHTVTVSLFEISTYEITQGQYWSVMGANPSSFTGSDNLPAENVTWWDAIKFCNALSRKKGLQECYNEGTGACDFTKNGFRLPTEAEWEYACRAGSSASSYWGNSTDETVVKQYCWYKSNADDGFWTTPHAARKGTQPVGQKTPNTWGLYDMNGNVEEWCNDWYGSYSGGSANDPTGAQTGYYRVFRGGGWDGYAFNCRSAYRYSHTPEYGGNHLGFRVVRR